MCSLFGKGRVVPGCALMFALTTGCEPGCALLGLVQISARLTKRKGRLECQEGFGGLYIDGDLPATDFHIFSSEFGFMGLFPMGERRFRLIASNPLSKPNKDTAPSIEELQQIYDQRSHIPARFHDMSWSSWFRINSPWWIASTRAADAQGMNTGIQDMINLAWKLAFVVKRHADPKLLDTYTDDRIPVIRNVLTKTEGLTDVINSDNPIFRSVFSHIAPWIIETEFVRPVEQHRTHEPAVIELSRQPTLCFTSFPWQPSSRRSSAEPRHTGGRRAWRGRAEANGGSLVPTAQHRSIHSSVRQVEGHRGNASFRAIVLVSMEGSAGDLQHCTLANAEQPFTSIFGSKPALIWFGLTATPHSSARMIRWTL